MTDVIDMHVQGIQCDAEGCDYEDPTVKLEDYKEWLNRPCPECGANLLTEEDHAAVTQMIEATQHINEVFREAGITREDALADVELGALGEVLVSMQTDTKGGIEIKGIKEVTDEH